MDFDLKVDVDLSGLDEELQQRLGLMSDAQKFVDSEFIRLTDPYVPFRTGATKDSALTNTVIGTGLITYATPYVRRIWSHPEFNFNGAPMRGAYWAQRSWADNGDDIVRGAAQIAGGHAE